jgi:ATP-dependent DNA helicase RecG
MKNSDKENIMNRFYLGEIDILVSTTVIEVGVDCKNATFMMIEDAGHFGLATLHQLRGRVGRGEFQSYTVFIDTTNTEKSTERLKTLVHTNDGFLIAEKDLELRGPGDFFGERQSGTVEFKIADMYGDYNIFKNAAEDAKKLLSNDKDLSNKQNELLKSKLDEYVKTYYTI